MIIDDKLVFSDAQAVTATGYSTNEINFGETNPNLGEGSPLVVRFVIETAFANATDMYMSIVHGAATAPTTILVSTRVYLEAELLKGAYLAELKLPDEHLQFVRIKYTVTGTHNAGAITAFLSLDR